MRKLLSLSKRKKVVNHVCQELVISGKRACKVLGQTRSTQRREVSPSSDEKQLTKDIIDLATKYGRYGYRLFVFRGIQEHIRSDNGPEFNARAMKKWLNRLGVKTLFIEREVPGRMGISNLLTVK